MIFLKEIVSSLPQTMQDPQTSDVEHGTGPTKNVSLALITGLLMPTKTVFLFLTNVLLMMNLALALHASRVMTLLMENVFSLPQTMLKLLTLVVPHGIGIIKSA